MKYTGTISSNGKQTTTQANQVIQLCNFPEEVKMLKVEAFGSPIHISLNNEKNTHQIDANSSIVFEDVAIYKMYIQESGVQYRYRGYLSDLQNKYTGTVSSSGQQTTTQTNTVYTFNQPVKYLNVEAFGSPVHIQINNETIIHEIDSSTVFELEGASISKLTITDNAGIQYRFTGFVGGEV